MSKQGITFIPTTDTLAWLSRCLIGTLKKPAEMGAALYLWFLHGYEEVKVSEFGGDSVLACFPSETSKQRFLEEETEWVKLWFSSLRPWENGDHAKNRRCWVTIRGMPLQAWCAEFFELVGSTCGQLIRVDPATDQRIFLEGARIEILTDQGALIEKQVEVTIAGERFQEIPSEASMNGGDMDQTRKENRRSEADMAGEDDPFQLT
ncbi:hypothetical protein Tsubulata_002260 [Turnera subulata]|uniref:DUF4283 domain-containing protein n=1 Tax=Turnera subulata TaxID=218843 RepID=A0A9Q0FXV3_9ROSI|nr:hypothetical protein Tsubulata_002260 [Turnera subulata]